MTNFTTEVYKNKEDGLIGARVIVYDNDKTPINEISIVDEESLKKITDLLATHNHDDRYYTKTEINNQQYISRKIVPSLPSTGAANILYLLPSDNDTYKMFFWIQELNAYKEVNNTNNDYIKNEIKKLTPNFSLDENGDLYIEYP